MLIFLFIYLVFTGEWTDTFTMLQHRRLLHSVTAHFHYRESWQHTSRYTWRLPKYIHLCGWVVQNWIEFRIVYSAKQQLARTHPRQLLSKHSTVEYVLSRHSNLIDDFNIVAALMFIRGGLTGIHTYVLSSPYSAVARSRTWCDRHNLIRAPFYHLHSIRIRRTGGTRQLSPIWLWPTFQLIPF